MFAFSLGLVINADGVRKEVTATEAPDITIRYNGQVFQATDVNGTPVYPLIINGTSYLPVRAVSSIAGLEVAWDGATQSILLSSEDYVPEVLEEEPAVVEQEPEEEPAMDKETDSQPAPSGDDDLDKATKAVYDTSSGDLVKTSTGQLSATDSNTHLDMWDKVKEVFPQSVLDLIYVFKVFDDGYGNTTGAAAPLDDYNDQYEFMLDPSDSLDASGSFTEDFDHTLVHEMFHIVSLNNTQLDHYATDHDGSTFTIYEGITKKNSYLNLFYQEFWSDIFDDHSTYADGYEFYDMYPNLFVTDYAATNPVEDIAESFTYFVLQDKASGSSVTSSKINFFYDFPELVEMRTSVRAGLGY